MAFWQARSAPDNHVDDLGAASTLRHPIEELILDARRAYQTKLDRQSHSIDQAVTEYRRRYGRQPPAGFEVWYDFVTRQHVKLIDEYDLINGHLEPCWALSPASPSSLCAPQCGS